MKANVTFDEVYPEYDLVDEPDHWTHELELADEFVARWKEVALEWATMQGFIMKKLRDTYGSDTPRRNGP